MPAQMLNSKETHFRNTNVTCSTKISLCKCLCSGKPWYGTFFPLFTIFSNNPDKYLQLRQILPHHFSFSKRLIMVSWLLPDEQWVVANLPRDVAHWKLPALLMVVRAFFSPKTEVLPTFPSNWWMCACGLFLPPTRQACGPTFV